MHTHYAMDMPANDPSLQQTLIKNQKCFSKLTDDEVAILAGLLEKVHYPAGKTIVSEGDAVDSVYFIVSGTAEVRHVYLENGEEVFNTLATLTHNQTIGLSETGFYSVSGLRTATVVAKTALEAFRLSIPAFNGFALAHPHVQQMMHH